MRALVVADGFIPAQSYLDAFARPAEEGEVEVRATEWSGDKAHHHHFGGDPEDTNRTSGVLVAQAVLEYVRTGRVTTAVNAADPGWT